ncbi:MAG: response regulator [Roseiflexus sp.]|jgi:two-component system cell cycle response regulator DivK|nr:response regulator [Roseiflexus sp.]MBO9364469.1 response regulator [Roseiflexus sp.]MBO9381080.1 response regulator [Roseiflexus sp.]MBO9387440.1 response regulator [Roseiflexus sp.]
MMIRPEDAYVLVIEDDANNLMITVDLLRMMGIRYVNARASGWQALKLIETMPRVDLVLLDIQLPYEDGYQVLRQLRAHPKLRTTRIAAVTANVLPQDEARARAAGFDGFIGKPIDFDRFPQQIRLLLEGARVWQPR